jgi:signal transduction histidine kinase
VFPIFQEILTNAARHSGATRLLITFATSRSSIRLDVRDNGRGIGPYPPRDRRHLGLVGMRERADAFGGRVVVSGVPDHGTMVRVRLPREPAAHP